MLKGQFDLFDGSRRMPPFRKGIDTSEAAAKSMVRAAPRQRLLVLSHIAEHSDGRTYDEVCAGLNMKPPSVCPRLKELADGGLIKDTGNRRKTRSGRPARIYMVTPDGLAVQA
jgi:DNA-binding transcriptional ArsR family regulator